VRDKFVLIAIARLGARRWSDVVGGLADDSTWSLGWGGFAPDFRACKLADAFEITSLAFIRGSPRAVWKTSPGVLSSLPEATSLQRRDELGQLRVESPQLHIGPGAAN
jgi:hypothetical protein